MPTWLMQGQSFLILALMFYGVSVHRQRAKHVRVMSVAIAWDVILILQVELSRQAILKASNALTNTMALNIHVALAVSTVIMYGAMIYSGRRVLRGLNHWRIQHKRMGWLTVTLRVLTFITSFWAVAPKA